MRNKDGYLKKERFTELWRGCGWEGALCKGNSINIDVEMLKGIGCIEKICLLWPQYFIHGENWTTWTSSRKLDSDLVRLGMSPYFWYRTRYIHVYFCFCLFLFICICFTFYLFICIYFIFLQKFTFWRKRKMKYFALILPAFGDFAWWLFCKNYCV